jgi:hypothetical protein
VTASTALSSSAATFGVAEHNATHSCLFLVIPSTHQSSFTWQERRRLCSSPVLQVGDTRRCDRTDHAWIACGRPMQIGWGAALRMEVDCATGLLQQLSYSHLFVQCLEAVPRSCARLATVVRGGGETWRGRRW